MNSKIPFNKPYFNAKALQYIENAINSNKICGDGEYSKKVNRFFEDKFNIRKTLFLTSGSTALDMSAILLDLKNGDEVILPSYTFVSTANAIMLRNAKPIFIDIDKDTLNIDPNLIESKINSNTKAIYPVHYAGIPCDMDIVLKIAKQYSLKIVEDAAQAVDAKYKGKYLGSIGDIGCYSFHETKNFTCGEGGAILINNESYIERAEIIFEKGTNRRKYFRGEVDKYTWVDIGSSFLASDILAAYLYSQLEEMDKITSLRREIYEFYRGHLKELEDKELLRLPVIPEFCTPNYHMFYIILNTISEQEKLMDYLKSKGILAIFHYIPLHSSPMGRKLGYKPEDLPITEEYSRRILRLPFYIGLTQEELLFICNSIKKFFQNKL